MAAPRVVPLVEPSEAEFTQQVIDLARYHKWRAFHLRPGMFRSGKWATAGSGDIAGWPDVFAVRGSYAVAAELKVGRGRPTVEQVGWLDALDGVPGVRVFVWWPRDWDEIVRVFR